MRRVKILATLGPTSENEKVLTEMAEAGMNAVRCNFSHGTAEDHAKRVELVRAVMKKTGKTIGILGDLQGPKIRIAKFENSFVMLEEGAEFVLDSSLPREAGNEQRVGIDYKELPTDVTTGDILLLDDGKIVFKVLETDGTFVRCLVETGGKLSNNKGINKLGGGLSADALTSKDKEDIKTAAALNMDYVAVSFVRSAADVELARSLLREAGSRAGIVAKIERAEAIDNIDEIIQASDVIMVARGDLAVEVGDAEVPGLQKQMIQRARELDTIAITATQMMESMIELPTPTRAEVSDVANAVIDGTDVVMLSAETASGKYPVKTIAAMDRVIRAVERYPETYRSNHRMECQFRRVDEAIAMATMYTANHLDVKAIIALTESGSSALWMSRIRSHLPIFALTRNIATMGRVTLYRGVIPIAFDSTSMPKEDVNPLAAQELVNREVVKEGDLVMLTSGDHMGNLGGTNKMKVLRIGSVI